MYDFNSIKDIKKEGVQKEILKMLKSRCFYLFYVCNCNKCDELLVSIHHKEVNGELLAYFICNKCGKKFVKKANYTNENNKNKLNVFTPFYTTYKNKRLYCVKRKNEFIAVLHSKNIKIK